MSENKNQIENVLELIEQVFPSTAEKISTIAFVNWHNILNHSALEGMDEKEILFCCNLILPLASVHFSDKNKDLNEISEKLKEVSFEDTISFLQDDSDEDEDEDEDEENFL
jgi:hypothetical protein